MTLNPPNMLPIRNIALAALVAFAAMTLWVVAPWGGAATWSADGAASSPPALTVDGEVQVTTSGHSVTQLVVPLTLNGEDGIRLTEGGRLHASTHMSESASAAVPARYSVAWQGGNGDEILDAGERAVVTVELPSPSSVHPGNPIDLIIRPIDGVALTVPIFD